MKPNNTVLITGGSGNLGGAVARRFSHYGWDTILLIRPESLGKTVVKELMVLPKVQVLHCDVENKEAVQQCIRALANAGTIPSIVFQSAGMFLWDDGFPSSNLIKPPDTVEQFLLRANYQTKVNVNRALEECMPEYVKLMSNHMIGSHAALWPADDPRRNGPYKEEYYVSSMQRVEEEGAEAARVFGSAIVHHTPLIDTPETRKTFTKERAPDITDELWENAINADGYAIELFPDTLFKNAA